LNVERIIRPRQVTVLRDGRAHSLRLPEMVELLGIVLRKRRLCGFLADMVEWPHKSF
jgi:hypothetical protein